MYTQEKIKLSMKNLYQQNFMKAPGGEIRLCCPICREKRYRLYICCNKSKRMASRPTEFAYGYAHCKNCNWKGKIKDIDNESYIRPSLRKVKEIPIVRKEFPFVPMSEAPPRFRRYLYNRISRAKADKYKILFSNIYPYFSSIILPVYDETGKIIFFQARKINDNRKFKYVSSRIADGYQSPSTIVFNLENILDNEQVVICEGFFNALSVKNGVALFGKNLSEVQQKQLLERNFKEYVVFLDNDAYKHGLDIAIKFKRYGHTVKVCKIPEYCNGDINENKEIAQQEINSAVPLSLNDLISLKIGGKF